ncbi:non-ribosomal peptide synthetase [Candidatus Leptofilum sp.]|uniref:non-ribosomal peptide synthetase n=1 Tax=Candidatus Leptofilum sp. TaxID=3241576 RepID=UPI003B5B1BE4
MAFDQQSESAELSAEELALLEMMLAEEGVDSSTEPTIPQRTNLEKSPLSFAQQRLWFLEQLEPGSPVYHIPAAFRLRGVVDTAVLQTSLNQLAQRHESLRTVFVSEAGTPYQKVLPEIELPLNVLDLRRAANNEQVAEKQLFAETQRPFNLKLGPLFRTTVFQLADDDFIIVFMMHHIISDGWSMGVLFGELTAVYNATVQNETANLPDLPIQYADFAEWQRNWLQGDVLAAQIGYWKNHLHGAPSLLELPLDKPRPNSKTFVGKRQSVTLDKIIADGLQTLARQEGATLFMAALAAFKVLLYRYTGQESVVVGSPVANRNRAEIEGLVGFFVNTLALHTDMSGAPSFRQLLGRVKEAALGAYDHQDVPFEKLVEELQPERSLNYNPIFQTLFTLETAARTPLQLAGVVNGRSLEVDFGAAKFDLSLSLTAEENGLIGSFVYNVDLFEPETLVRMAGHLQTLAAAIVANPDQPITQLNMLTEAEWQQLAAWNSTAVTYNHPVPTVYQLFELQVEKTPDKLALIYEDVEMSYSQLNEKANQLAHYLQKQGVKPETLVGISVERSPDMVIALLGIFKAGGAYLPLDPTYPQERLAYMLADSGVKTLLTQEHLLPDLPETEAAVFLLDSDWHKVENEPTSNLDSGVSPENLAYVIYTSGSTGRPKGVLVTHRGIPNLAEAQIETFGLTPESRCLQFASFSFDASVSEVTTTLLAGATLVLAPQRSMMPGPALIHLLRDKEITVVTLPPSALAVMSPDELSGVKSIISAGEACSAEIAAKWLPGRRFVNAYGPTEATVCTTMNIVEKVDGTPPIGKPINNFQTLVLDANQQPLPQGIPGELYIGSELALARGYHNRPDLTAEKFVELTLDERISFKNRKFYRSGDLVKWLPDGSLEFLGRIDHQVKVRGFRIELGEIETALREHTAVQEALVLAREDKPGDKRLVAYLLSANGSTPSPTNLRSFLQETLPDYMVPNAFVSLEAFPISPNGKVDRKALPAPSQDVASRESSYVAPGSRVERQLATIWEQILGVSQVGIHDNFFSLGGHSLLATQLFAQIDKQIVKGLPITLLFQYPTVAQLAEVIEKQRPSDAWSALVPIKEGGNRPPFYMVHGGAGHVFNYQKLADNLADDQPFYGVQPPDWTGHRVAPPKVEELAQKYVAEIRQFQPEGPYYLGGFCFGGMVVYEIARLLQEAGKEVAVLALLEPSALGTRNELLVQNQEGVGPNVGELPLFGFDKNVPKTVVGKVRRAGYGIVMRSRRRLLRTFRKLKRLIFSIYVATGAPILRQHRDYYLMEFVTGKSRILYRPDGTFRGQIDMFMIRRGRFMNQTLGWDKVASERVQMCQYETDHIGVIQEPVVQQVASALQARLDEAQKANG